jgi:hypothetical protein
MPHGSLADFDIKDDVLKKLRAAGMMSASRCRSMDLTKPSMHF